MNHQDPSVSVKTSRLWVPGKISKPTLLDLELDLVVISRELSQLVVLLSKTTSSLRELRQSVLEQELVYLEKTGGY